MTQRKQQRIADNPQVPLWAVPEDVREQVAAQRAKHNASPVPEKKPAPRRTRTPANG